MEHEINQLIRSKVRQAEDQPVHWQKERVWDMLALKPELKPRRRMFYYAAASIVLVVSAILYLVQVSNQKKLELKVTPLASVHNKSAERNPSNPKTATVGVHISPVEVRHPGIVTPEEKFRRPMPATNIADISNPEVTPDKTEVTVLTINRDEQQPLPESTEITIEEPPVKAIVGFVPEQRAVASASKIKRSKFHFFKPPPPEVEAFQGEETKLLTARIN